MRCHFPLFFCRYAIGGCRDFRNFGVPCSGCKGLPAHGNDGVRFGCLYRLASLHRAHNRSELCNPIRLMRKSSVPLPIKRHVTTTKLLGTAAVPL